MPSSRRLIAEPWPSGGVKKDRDPGRRLTASNKSPVIAGSNEHSDTSIATRRGPLALFERIALAAASTMVSINVCTGFPLLALWIGSRAASGNVLSWTGVITGIVSLAILAALGVAALTRLSARYDRVTGRPRPTRQQRPWETAMGAPRIAPGRSRWDTNPVEVIVVLTVVVAFIAFEIWFFFFAGPVY